ncbi:MAG: NfeD family protein [Rubricoccaceae bacterium]
MSRFVLLASILLLTVAGSPAAPAQAAPATALAFEEPLGDGPVYFVTVDGLIDSGLARYLDRALSDAESAGAALVVFRIDTFGGLVDAADRIRKRILGAGVPTLAVVDRNAISAGALIAYAADRIVMVPGSVIGAATVVEGGSGEAAPDKYQSAMRALMRATAEANGRDPRIAEAMVDERIAIPGVTEEGQLLTLSYDEARRLGVADAVVASTAEAVAAAGLEGRTAVEHSASRTERLLRVLSSPAVASILLLLMLGGVYFELQTPGIGFAGATALVAATLFFAPHYLMGLVESWEIALFALGVILLLVEVFVLPGFGLFGIAGVVAVLGALLFSLIPNVGFVYPSQAEIARATATLAAALVLVVLLAVSLGRYLPRSSAFGRLVLAPDLSAAQGYTASETDRALVPGLRGTAATALRPAGTALLDGRRVDVVAEGGFVLPGTPVEVVSARGNRVVVRPVGEAPPLPPPAQA